MEQPLVSIIIPVYNTGRSATKLITKLQAGNYQNLDIILVDDGSTDESLKYLLPQASTSQTARPHVRILTQKHQGASTARNLGLKKAKGKYVIFLDSDDHISRRFISRLVQAISQPQTALAVTGIRFLYRDGSIKDAYTHKLRHRRNKESYIEYLLYLLFIDGRIYSSVNKIYHTQIIKQGKVHFRSQLSFAEDTHFVLDYLKACKKYSLNEIFFINQPLYIYHYDTPTSNIIKSSANWQNWQKSHQLLQKWVGTHPSMRSQILLKLILLRWQYSYQKAKLHIS